MSAELSVDAGDATPEMIEAAFAEILAEAGQTGSEVWSWAEREGIDPAVLGGVSLIEVVPQERDFGLSVAVIVAGTLAADVLGDLWDDFVRPRIRQKFHVEAGEPTD